jgi:hypothetical protein
LAVHTGLGKAVVGIERWQRESTRRIKKYLSERKDNFAYTDRTVHVTK